jgi:hypothetical protein
MDEMTNLLTETREAIEEVSLITNDVAWIGSRDGRLALLWDQFATLADVNYDDGYGSVEVAIDLVIVFKDGGGWLERYEYDGSEGWVYKAQPRLDPAHRPFSRVVDPGRAYDGLAHVNHLGEAAAR